MTTPSASPRESDDVTGSGSGRTSRLLALTRSVKALFGGPKRSVTRVHVKPEDDVPFSDSSILTGTTCSGGSGSLTPTDGWAIALADGLTPPKHSAREELQHPSIGDEGPIASSTDAPGSRGKSKREKSSPDAGKDSHMDPIPVGCVTPPLLSQDKHDSSRSTPHIPDRTARKLTPVKSSDDSPLAVGMATHGVHATAADTAVVRAVKGDTMGSSPRATPRRSRQIKVIVHPSEKEYILSLKDIDVPEAAAEHPPLLGYGPAPERFGALSGPSAGERDGDSAGGGCVVPLGPKKTLILDLDETLISSTRIPSPCDFKIVFRVHSASVLHRNDHSPLMEGKDEDVDMADDSEGLKSYDEDEIQEINYFVRVRPGLAKFLANVAAIFELVIWTASGKAYADAILDRLDPEGKLFSKRLYRDSCVGHRGLCVKDLRRLGRPMNSVVLLDNFVYSFGFTLNNGLPIPPWTGTQGSNESGLATAFALLHRLARKPDVRTPLIKAFDLHCAVHGMRSSSLSPRVTPAPAEDDSSAAPLSRHTSRGRSGYLRIGGANDCVRYERLDSRHD